MLANRNASTIKVYRVAWWMSLFAAPTPKRHYAWANTSEIIRLDHGHCVWLLSVPDSPSKSKRPRDPGTKLVKSLARERMPFAPLRTLLQQVYTRINLFVRTPFALIWNLLPSQPSAACQPREYPMQFGRHLARNCEALKAACSAKPIVPAELPCATEIFQSMAYGANAELWSFRFEICFQVSEGW